MIVGLKANMKAGKSTAAKVLIEEFGFVRTPFAAGVKAAAAWVLNNLGEPYGKRWPTIEAIDADKAVLRPLLQAIGNTARDAIDPDVWVVTLLGHIERAGHLNYVIDDVRYPNEVAAIQQAGGVVILIDTPDWLRLARLARDEGRMITSDEWIALHNHPSESQIYTTPHDLVISGGLPLDEYQEQVRSVVRGLSDARP